MNFTIRLILVLLLSFIESTIIFLPLTIFSLALFSLYEKTPAFGGSIFILGMLAGLAIDLLQVRSLGTTSLIFLVILSLIFLYKRKIMSKNPIFIGLAIFLSSFSYSYLILRQFSLALWQALILTFLTLVFLVLFRSIIPALR